MALSGWRVRSGGSALILNASLKVMIGLVVGQATGLMLFNLAVSFAACAVLLVIDVGVFLAVVGRFRRERIVTTL